MEILIHIETKKLDNNLKKAMDEYIKRTSPYCRITIKTYKSLSKMSPKKGSKVYHLIPGDSSPTSEGMAQLIQELNLTGISCIEFIIGETNLEVENFNISSFSMSEDLTATVLTEQIYRAYTILNNIVYHK